MYATYSGRDSVLIRRNGGAFYAKIFMPYFCVSRHPLRRRSSRDIAASMHISRNIDHKVFIDIYFLQELVY